MKDNHKQKFNNNNKDTRVPTCCSQNSYIATSPNIIFIDLFELLKAFNEKLLIVFANIRV